MTWKLGWRLDINQLVYTEIARDEPLTYRVCLYDRDDDTLCFETPEDVGDPVGATRLFVAEKSKTEYVSFYVIGTADAVLFFALMHCCGVDHIGCPSRTLAETLSCVAREIGDSSIIDAVVNEVEKVVQSLRSLKDK